MQARRNVSPYPMLASVVLALLLPSCPQSADPDEPDQTEPVTSNEESDSMPGDPLTNIRAFIQEQGIDFEGGTSRTALSEPPLLTFDANTDYFWNIQTNRGAIKVKLWPQIAPMHVSSTLYLVESGFYDGLLFHRVIPGFMAQGGCPLGAGYGNPGYQYGSEIDDSVRHDRGGLLSMANTGQPNTDGSQFFLTFAPAPHLDGKHTLFGEVVEGMETLKELESYGTPGGTTTVQLKMTENSITTEPK